MGQPHRSLPSLQRLKEKPPSAAVAVDALALCDRLVELIGEHETRKPNRSQEDFWLYNRVRSTVGAL
jgi:hypothetical protein